MIKDHRFNADLSLEVYEECRDLVKSKQCYSNTYYVAVHYADKFHAKEWKVAYGFIRILPDSNMWARHAFIINKNGEAIDPTFYSHKSIHAGDENEHKSFHVFHDIARYANIVRLNNNIPDLLIPLRKKEAKMGEWAEKNNMVLFGGVYTGIEKHYERLRVFADSMEG